MARNYVQPGETVTLTAPANVKSGDVVVVGSLSALPLMTPCKAPRSRCADRRL